MNRFAQALEHFCAGARVLIDVPSMAGVRDALSGVQEKFGQFASEVGRDRDATALLLADVDRRLRLLEHPDSDEEYDAYPHDAVQAAKERMACLAEVDPEQSATKR